MVLSPFDITEIEKQRNVIYQGFAPNGSAKYREYRGQEHTDVRLGWLDGWLYVDGTLVVPFSRGFEVFDPLVTAFTAASPEALDDLLQGDERSERDVVNT